MKAIGKILKTIVILIIIFLVIGMSIILLNMNEFGVSRIGDKTLLIVDQKMKDYSKGSLLIVSDVAPTDVKAGDYIFYYNEENNVKQTVLVEVKEVITGKGNSVNDVDYVLPNDAKVNSQYLVGTTNSTKEYKNWGKILGVLESKWGNLFLVVVPAFLLFMYELFNVIFEFKVFNKSNKKKEKKQEIVEE